VISLETMQLGKTKYNITRLGMGCWAIGGHGWGQVQEEDSMQAIKCALDNGITFFDTADVYGLGKSEELLAKVLGSSNREVVIASKGGVRWNKNREIWPDISPAYLRLAVENSLKRLKLDCIPLYYIHKPDQVTPIQESVSSLERMKREGKIGAIGLSNFSLDQVLIALQVAPITSIQVRLNLFDGGSSKELIDFCKENSITLVAWGALADGLLTGKFNSATEFSNDDHRSRMKEFGKENFEQYDRCVKLLSRLAFRKGRIVGQLALRWVLDLAPVTCSLFGAKTDVQVKENLGANGWNLTHEELLGINSILCDCGIQ